MDQPNLDDAKRPKIYFATPAYMGQITTRYFHSMMNTGAYLMQLGVNFEVSTLPNCSLISLGRNIMVARALRESPDWTHFMFIDSDIEWDPRFIHSMLADDKDIIGGFYPKKGLPIDFASCPDPVNQGKDVDEPVYESAYAATGFMLIKREVLEKMNEFYPERRFFYQGSDEYYDLFAPYIDTNMPNRLYLTEDFAFCRLAQAAGFKTYLSKRFSLKHWGVFCFSKTEEENMLKEYERMGYIDIKQMHPDWGKVKEGEEGKIIE